MTMRNHYLDSSKAILIFLVVLGHFLERMIGWDDSVNHAVLGLIYFIHMPAFILISGMLYKDKNWFKNIIFFIALYVPFQILFPAFDALWTGKFQLNLNIFERPYWILWYLLGMMVWTLLTHILLKIHKYALFIAVLLSLLIGLSPWNNYQYSIGRIFTFFPFFIFGVLYGNVLIQKIEQIKRASLGGILILLMIVSLAYFTQLNQFWLYGSLSYVQFNVDWLNGTLIRLGCLIVSSCGICALLSLPKLIGERFIRLGETTLPVYLLHAFVVMCIARFWRFDFNIFVEIGICIVLSVITCWILQHQFFDTLLRKMSLWFVLPIEKLRNKAQ